ncbi:hypothetical protein LINGRAHAP2_LOCUS23173 [Linum grandiflorum]
MGRCSGHPFG